MTFNVWTFLFEIINFLVLAYVLHRLLYRPLRTAIEQRQAVQAAALAEAESARRQTAEMQTQLQAQSAALDVQRQAALREAREQAEAERRRFLAEGGQALQQRQSELQRDLERERREMMMTLQADIVEQSVAMAERLIGEAAGSDLQHQFVLRLAESLEQFPEPERNRLRVSTNGDAGATLESAGEVESAVLERLTRAVSSVLGKQVAVTVISVPALISGARLRVGGQIWDASVAGQWDELRRN